MIPKPFWHYGQRDLLEELQAAYTLSESMVEEATTGRSLTLAEQTTRRFLRLAAHALFGFYPMFGQTADVLSLLREAGAQYEPASRTIHAHGAAGWLALTLVDGPPSDALQMIFTCATCGRSTLASPMREPSDIGRVIADHICPQA